VAAAAAGWGLAFLPTPDAAGLTYLQADGASHLAFEGETSTELVAGTPENWEVACDPQAAVGAGLSAGGSNSTADSPHSFVQYNLHFSAAGTYYLYYRWKADEARTGGDVFTANSSWLPVDFGDLRTPGDQLNFYTSDSNAGTQAPATNTLQWRREIDGREYIVDPADVGVAQVFSVGTREAGMVFDRFVFSTDPDLMLNTAQLEGLPNSETDIVAQAACTDFVAWEAEKKVSIIAGTPENWEIQDLAGANQGRALTAAGPNSTADSPHSFAQYGVRFATAGTYYLYYRWRAEEARTAGDVFTANSSWLPVEFGDYRTPGANEQVNFYMSDSNVNTQAPATNTFQWRREIDGREYIVDPADVGVTQVFSVGTREAGMTFDRFVFSTVADLMLNPAQLDALVNSGESPLAPELRSAAGSASFTVVTVVFTRPLDPASVAPEDFTLDGGLVVSAAAVDPDDSRNVTLTTTEQAQGVDYTLTVSGVTDTAGVPIALGSQIGFTAWVLRDGWVRKELYFTIPGTSTFDLQADPRYIARTPDRVEYVRGFQLNQSPQTNDYGARLETFFRPSQGGVWDFFVNNDDEAEVFLSNDTSEAGLASLGVFFTSLPVFDELLSVPTPSLQADTSYLLVGELKQGGGDVFLNVAARPGSVGDPPAEDLDALGGSLIATFIDPALGEVMFDAQPQPVTAPEGGRARFSVAVTPASANPVYYQWRKNGTDLAGGSRASYTTPVLAASDNGAQFTCVVSVAGRDTESAAAALTVGPAAPTGLEPYIGVNFVGGGVLNGVGDSLASAEVAGFVPQENWNNLGELFYDLEPLVDATGADSPVRLTLLATEEWYTGTTVVSSGDAAVLQGFIANGALLDPLTATFAGVPDGTYNIYIYCLGFDFSPDYRQSVQVVGATTPPALHVEAETGLAYVADPAWRLMDSTDPNARDKGNYAVIEGVSPGAGGTFDVSLVWEPTGVGNDHQPALNGIQIVRVGGTEPPSGPFEITSVSLAGGLLSVTWTGGVGPFDVLFSTSMADGSWNAVESDTAARDAVVPVAVPEGYVRILDKGQ
jgi:hypothetical protein